MPHQHFVADVAFKVSAHVADSGIDFRDECSELGINSRQESIPCCDVCFRAYWHAGGFTTGGCMRSSMMESPNGYDSQSFLDVAAAGQGRPCEGAYGDLLRESELQGM